MVAEQAGDFSGDPGEESSFAADVDGDAGGGDHDATDVAVQCSACGVGREEHGAVDRLAASL